MHQQAIDRCQEIIGYTFNNPELLTKALTHSSVASTKLDSNERLEFLGDSVLGLTVCDYLYRNFDLLEGEMTKIKSTVVSRKTCASIIQNINLHELLFLGGDMSDPSQIPSSVAAALFESIIGAIYIDSDFETASQFILKYIVSYINNAMSNQHQENYKSLLQQIAQKETGCVPKYILLDEQGPDHSKCFEIAVEIGGRHFTSAWGKSKKDAEQVAARRALETLGVLQPEPPVGEVADTLENSNHEGCA